MRPTAARLRELFEYDPLTGVLTWRVSRRGIRVGSEAGYVQQDGLRRQVGIDGGNYFAHRVIWCMQTGAWPTLEIDHRDTNGINNVWTNLREATRAQNNRNRCGYGKSGLKGVHGHKGKFVAQIRKDGVQMHLGRFETALSAHAAYSRAAVEWHGEFARLE